MPTKRERGYLLPAVIDPPRVCLKIEIPSDEKHILAFWGALETLGHAYNWADDDSHTALDVAQVWRDVWLDARASFLFQDCGTFAECNTVTPRDALVAYHPCSPFDQTCDLPAGYTYPPFTVVNSDLLTQIIGEWGLGYQQGDVYTDLTKLPQGSWSNILEGWRFFPRIEITTPAGAGTVKIELLNIPQGGRALIVVDDDFDLLHLRLVELNKDIVSFPPETAVPLVYEVEVTGEGSHLVEVAFIPTVDDTPLPIFFGGGFRSVEFCNFGAKAMAGCCAPSTKALQKIANGINHSQAMQFFYLDDGVSPRSFAPDAPEQFDMSTGDDDPTARYDALCDAVYRYVYSVLDNYANSYAAADLLESILSQFPPFGFIFGIVDALTDIGEQALSALLQDHAAIRAVICQMVTNLRGQDVTRAVFHGAVDPTAFEALSNEYQIAVLVDTANAYQENYRAFVAILGEQYETVKSTGSQYECCGCEDELILSDPLYGATITPLGGCNFRIQQSTPDGQGRYRASVTDDLLRTIMADYPDEQYTLQAIAGSTVTGADGCPDYNGDNYGGGFVPSQGFSAVNWWSQDAIDTVIKFRIWTGTC